MRECIMDIPLLLIPVSGWTCFSTVACRPVKNLPLTSYNDLLTLVQVGGPCLLPGLAAFLLVAIVLVDILVHFSAFLAFSTGDGRRRGLCDRHGGCSFRDGSGGGGLH